MCKFLSIFSMLLISFNIQAQPGKVPDKGLNITSFPWSAGPFRGDETMFGLSFKPQPHTIYFDQKSDSFLIDIPNLEGISIPILREVYEITECCGWKGTWTKVKGSNNYEAKWRHDSWDANHAPSTDIIQLVQLNLENGEVEFYRLGNQGTYKAKYNYLNGWLTDGWASWYPVGETWSGQIK